jgi:hypothetical protein
MKDKPLFPSVKPFCYDKLQTKTECECGGTLFHVELLLYSDTGYEDKFMEMSGILYECVACGYIHTAWRD